MSAVVVSVPRSVHFYKMVAFRLLFVDVFGHILPLTELKLIAYIPRASNLFGVFSLASLCAALELKKAE